MTVLYSQIFVIKRILTTGWSLLKREPGRKLKAKSKSLLCFGHNNGDHLVKMNHFYNFPESTVSKYVFKIFIDEANKTTVTETKMKVFSDVIKDIFRDFVTFRNMLTCKTRHKLGLFPQIRANIANREAISVVNCVRVP